MIEENDKVLCALSGGADSVFLLHYLLENNIAVCAAHYNHLLRGDEAMRDEQFVVDMCKTLGVECMTERGDVKAFAKENGLGTEEAARFLRYDFLMRARQTMAADFIATAHNQNDNAETILLNLTRGTGLSGLCGIPPQRGNIIRPILDINRSEIEVYLAENGIDYVEDSSNAENIYSRNIIRHEVLPVLQSINSGFLLNSMRASEHLREDEMFLQSLADKFLKENINDRGLSCEALVSAPKPVAVRALTKFCAVSLSEKHILAVLDFCKSTMYGTLDLPKLKLIREQSRLKISTSDDENVRNFEDIEVKIEGETEILELGYKIKAEKIIKPYEIHSSLNTFFFNYEKICGTIFFGFPKKGDKIRLAKRNCTKKLSDLFNETKMTKNERETTPVLRDDLEIIAVGSFGVGERVAYNKGDILLKIEIEDMRRY